MTLPETDLNHPAPAPLWLPALVTGFGTAVAMWTVWWITHLPTGQDFAPPWNVSLPLLALVLVGGVVLGSRHAAKPILSGTIAGLVTAALALIVLGAVLSDTEGETASAEAARSFRDDAPVIVLGFLAASAVAGALGGLMGLALRARGHSTESRWVGRMAIVAACSFLPLIAIGGAVTSTASGMAVTEPVVSFVMPLKLMAEPRVFIEHTHRLVGSLVGLTAIALLVTTLLTTTRPSGRVIAGVLLALVATQGTLGIFRVGENSSVLAMFHGMFAQLVFATGVAAAAWLSPRFADPEPSRPAACDRAAQKAYPLAVAALALYAFQLATGAASRHFGAQHATLTHVG
ncbi:MAG: COX15/CtaA family protein, partial [Planctomycetota bacterium]